MATARAWAPPRREQSGRALSALLPSVLDIPFIAIVLGLGLRFNRAMLNGDGDLARHLRVGSSMLDQRQILHRDIFSFTLQGRPFVPYEWLSEVSFALGYRVGGLAAVAVLTALIIGATYLAVVAFLRRRGVERSLVLLTALAASGISSVHWLARPHIVTPLFAILTLGLLESDERGRRPWRYAPLFALWANLHGGFLFGLVVIAVYLAGDALEWRWGDDPARWAVRLREHLWAFVVALLSCALTPAGLGLFPHVSGYLGQRYLVDITQEYQTPNFHNPLVQAFLLALLASVGALALSSRRPRFPRLLLILTTIAFALYSGRNVPLFAVTALPLVAVEFDPTWRRRPVWLARLTASLEQVQGRTGASAALWPLLATLAVVAVGLSGGDIAGRQLSTAHFDETRFPVQAVAQARAAGLTGHLYADLPWGGYLLWAWPEQQVFIDGQTDFYGEALMRTRTTIENLDPGWREALASWDIALVLTPSDSRLAAELAREPGWRVWYRDGTAMLLQRERAKGDSSETEPRA